jgi:hypothetical protein
LTVEDDPSDNDPPSALRSVDASWEPLDDSGCGGGQSSCADTYLIRFEISPGNGVLPAGYLIEVVDGEPPPGVNFPADPIVAQGTTIFVHYSDSADSPREFSFSVEVTPVDEAGNVGETTGPISISNRDTGCHVVPVRGRRSGFAFILLALAALGRRASKRRPM